jgi:hypothetical protein
MTRIFVKRGNRQAVERKTFFISYRLLTGTGRTEASSAEQVLAILDELRGTGASNITVVDHDGRLVSFDPGGSGAQ